MAENNVIETVTDSGTIIRTYPDPDDPNATYTMEYESDGTTLIRAQRDSHFDGYTFHADYDAKTGVNVSTMTGVDNTVRTQRYNSNGKVVEETVQRPGEEPVVVYSAPDNSGETPSSTGGDTSSSNGGDASSSTGPSDNGGTNTSTVTPSSGSTDSSSSDTPSETENGGSGEESGAEESAPTDESSEGSDTPSETEEGSEDESSEEGAESEENPDESTGTEDESNEGGEESKDNESAEDSESEGNPDESSENDGESNENEEGSEDNESTEDSESEEGSEDESSKEGAESEENPDEATEEGAAEEENAEPEPGVVDNGDGTSTRTEIEETENGRVITQTTYATDDPDRKITEVVTTVNPDTGEKEVATSRYNSDGTLDTITYQHANGDVILVDAAGNRIGSITNNRPGQTDYDILIDVPAFIDTYIEVLRLCESAAKIEGIKTSSSSCLTGLARVSDTTGSGHYDKTKVGGISFVDMEDCDKCLKDAGGCQANGEEARINNVALTMRNIIDAMVSFDADAAAAWEAKRQEVDPNWAADVDQGVGPEAEDAGSTPTDATDPGDAGTEEAGTEAEDNTPDVPDYYDDGPGYNPPANEKITEAKTEAKTEITSETKIKQLETLLGVDMEDLANDAKKVVYGEEFDGVNILYDSSITGAALSDRVLNILNYFGVNSDDQKLYDESGNPITKYKEGEDITFKYKKDGKEHKVTLKVLGDTNYDGDKYSGIQLKVN